MIFLDFDGTIVDLWPRYFAVFRDLTGLEALNIEEYRLTKRKYIKDSKVADFFGITLPSNYFEQKREMLEDRKYLRKDRLLFTTEELWALLIADTVVLTKRRNEDSFYWELSYLGIECKASVIHDVSKKEWIKRNYPFAKGIIVGDSLADLEAAKLPNIEAFMVGYGLNTKEQFDSIDIGYKYIDTPKDLLEELIMYRGSN